MMPLDNRATAPNWKASSVGTSSSTDVSEVDSSDTTSPFDEELGLTHAANSNPGDPTTVRQAMALPPLGSQPSPGVMSLKLPDPEEIRRISAQAKSRVDSGNARCAAAVINKSIGELGQADSPPATPLTRLDPDTSSSAQDSSSTDPYQSSPRDLPLARTPDPDIQLVVDQRHPAGAASAPVWPHLPRGNGACCLVLQSLLAGLPAALTTASSFTVKAWVEFAVANAVGLAGVTDTTTQNYIAGAAGGLAAGALHTAAAKFWGSLVNATLSIDSFAVNPGHSKMLAETLTNDLAVYLGFCGAYAAHDFIQPGTFPMNDWNSALRKTLGNLTGGFATGVILYGLRSAAVTRGVMKRVEAAPVPRATMAARLTQDPYRSQMNAGHRVRGHDLSGRVVGGVIGMTLATAIMATAGLGAIVGTGASGVGMAVFLLGWFGFIHLFEAIGRCWDHQEQARDVAAVPDRVTVEDITDNIEDASDAGSQGSSSGYGPDNGKATGSVLEDD